MRRSAYRSSPLLGLALVTTLACSTPAPSRPSPDVVAPPTATVEPPRPAQPPPPAQEPFVLAPVDIAMGDLIVTASHVYWLELRSRAKKQRRTSGAARGLLGFGAVLMCDEAGGALMRVDRMTREKETVAELEYRPFSLAFDGRRLYWTGAPCTGRPRTSTDPEWLWTWDTTPGGAPAPLGDRDRNYLDLVTTKGAAYVSDRFGRGGAFRFVDGGSPELIVPESEQPWVVAVDDRSFFWSDRSWMLWETDVNTRKATQRLSLGAMPSDSHLFDGGLVVRTSSEVLVISRPAWKIEHRVEIGSYGDRGVGALAEGRFYLWADGTNRISRLDVQTGELSLADSREAKEACGVAYDAGTVYWIDRKRDAIFAWPSPAFTRVLR
jgi:hypothetical protein